MFWGTAMEIPGKARCGRGRLLRAALTAAVALSIGGCVTRGPATTGSIPLTQGSVARMNKQQLDAMTRNVGAAYAANPKDRNTGLNYASLLRMTGQADQALAVMQQVAINHPEDREVLAAYGKAQAAAGNLDQALETIRRAQTPDHPDWRLLSAEGAILDQLGRSEAARDLYRKARTSSRTSPRSCPISACPTC